MFSPGHWSIGLCSLEFMILAATESFREREFVFYTVVNEREVYKTDDAKVDVDQFALPFFLIFANLFHQYLICKYSNSFKGERI